MQTVETILGNKPPLRRAILLEYAKHPDGILVKEIEKRLGVSGLDKNHLKKLEEFGILERHYIEVSRPAGRFKAVTVCMDKGYRLKQDPETLYTLLNIFAGTEYIHDFISSDYVIWKIKRSVVRGVVLQFVKERVDKTLYLATVFFSGAELQREMEPLLNAQYQITISHERVDPDAE